MAGISVTAPVLEVEHRKGDFRNDQGENIAYDFHVAHLHLGGANILQCKIRNDNADAPIPAEGSWVTVEVELPKGTRVTAKRITSVRTVED